METVFTWSAIVGGGILVIQTLLTVLGTGAHDLDVDHSLDFDHSVDLDHADAAQDQFFGILSFRALVAFATFFGLAGLAANRAEFGSSTTLVVALGAGIAAMFAIGQIMLALARLQSSGNVDLRRAIGERANVYLRIPASGHGQGRVHVTVQGRRLELPAVARGEEIATGQEVRVVDLGADETLVVEPIH